MTSAITFLSTILTGAARFQSSSVFIIKGESRHALARAVFLHQLGELRDRIAETIGPTGFRI